jgi:sugar lactone lactonase YvrE
VKLRTSIYAFAAITLVMFMILTPALGGPVAQGNPTELRQTLNAIIYPRQTQTAAGQVMLTQTVYVQQTVFEAINQTLRAAGPSGVPGGQETIQSISTGTISGPLNATDQYETIVANVNVALTQTAGLSGTAAYQGTLNSIINQTLGVTPTAPTATPTLLMPTAVDVVNQRLTQTVDAMYGQTATAALQGTIGGIVNAQQTATGQVVQATLTSGLEQISLANATRLTSLLTLQGHTKDVVSVTFSPDGTVIASGSLDNTVRIWDTLSGAQVTLLQGLTDRQSVAFSSDGTRLAAASSDQTIRLWDAHSGAELSVLKGHTDSVNGVVFSPDSTLLASVSSDKSVRLWSTKGNSQPGLLKGHRQAVLSLAFSPDGARLASGGKDQTLIIWEAKAGIQLAALRDFQTIYAIAFSPDGSTVVSAGDAGIVQLWTLDNSARPRLFRGPVGWLTSVAFNRDGTILAAGSRDGSIWLWDVKTGNKLVTLKGHTGGVSSIAFSPDGTRLVSGSYDKTVHVWGIRAK